MTVPVTVRFWAGARRAAGRDSAEFSASTLADLIDQLKSDPALTDICTASSYLVDGLATAPETTLSEGAVIDVLPPFAGG